MVTRADHQTQKDVSPISPTGFYATMQQQTRVQSRLISPMEPMYKILYKVQKKTIARLALGADSRNGLVYIMKLSVKVINKMYKMKNKKAPVQGDHTAFADHLMSSDFERPTRRFLASNVPGSCLYTNIYPT